MEKEGLHVMYYMTQITFYSVFAWGIYGYNYLWTTIDGATEFQLTLGSILLWIQGIYFCFDITDNILDAIFPDRSMYDKIKDGTKHAIKDVTTCACLPKCDSKNTDK